MTGRRAPHTKSRLGCGQCKKRRVKCDGERPSCAACRKRGFECTFLLLVPCTQLSAAGPSTSRNQSPAFSAPNSSDSPQSDLSIPDRYLRLQRALAPSPQTPLSLGLSPDALRLPRGTLVVDDKYKTTISGFHQVLLNHYTNSTSLTLATDVPTQKAWQAFVPGMASEHIFLVHGVLSVTSLDLARLCKTEDERVYFERVAVEQMNRGLHFFRNELQDINQRNAAALFAHSTLTAVYLYRTSALDMGAARASVPSDQSWPPQQLIDKMIQSFTRTLIGVRGAMTVLMPGWKWIVNGKLATLFSRQWWPKHPALSGDRARREDKILANLERSWTGSELQPPSPHARCLSQALSYLRQTYALVSILTDPDDDFRPQLATASVPYSYDKTTVGILKDRASIMVWATQITQEFITLVEQKNQDALVLVAHYAVLFGRIQGVWWIENLGAHTVWAVAVAIGRENWHLVQWAADAIDVNLEEVSRGSGTNELNPHPSMQEQYVATRMQPEPQDNYTLVEEENLTSQIPDLMDDWMMGFAE